MGWTLYLFFYVSILTTIVIIIRKFAPLTRSGKSNPIPASDETEELLAKELDSNETKQRTSLGKLAGTYCDALLLSACLVGLAFCFLKLGASYFDFPSFKEGPELSLELMFAWLCLAVFFMLSGFKWLGIKRDGNASHLRSKATEMIAMGPQLFVIPIFICVFDFGRTIFPRIPFAIGGGAPREVIVKTKETANSLNGRKFFLLGESSQFFFLVGASEKTALQISKDSILSVETIYKTD